MSIPGLPSLSPEVGALFSQIALVISDGINVSSMPTFSQWGIFLNGEPVVVADNVLSMEFRQDFRISNYPIEQGAFASYNKVQMPFEVKFRFSTGGSVAKRSAMLDSIAAVIGDTNLYDVVTPDAIYLNVNFTHQDYRRSAQSGNGLLSVDIWCEEVRSASLIIDNSGTVTSTGTAGNAAGTVVTGQTSFNNFYDAVGIPQSPSAAPQVNGGNVTAGTPTTAENAPFMSALTAQGNLFND